MSKSDYTEHSTIPVPDSLQGASKNYLPFLTQSLILDDVKLAELSNNSFEWKNVTFLGGGVKTYSDYSYIFPGVKSYASAVAG